MDHKAHTAEKISKHLEDSGDIGAVKCCSRCNRVYVFYADDASCPACDDGNLLPLSRYLPMSEMKH